MQNKTILKMFKTSILKKRHGWLQRKNEKSSKDSHQRWDMELSSVEVLV